MTQQTVKSLKAGEFFTRKALENPTEMQVYVRGSYDRETKTYVCHKFGDVNHFTCLSGHVKVFTGFTF